ncbi:MAG: hypothetical protein ACLUD2_15075 [Clostridium sp.]
MTNSFKDLVPDYFMQKPDA